MDRRRFLSFSAASAVTGALPQQSHDGMTLQQAASKQNICFGSEVTSSELATIPGYGNLLARECAIITPGLEAKWAAAEPQDGVFAFEKLDEIVAFATAHHLKLHMHNLIWSVFLPRWTLAAIASGRAASVMARHISTLVSRYQDRVDSWDVVNEPADPRWPSGAEGLCTTPWRRALGPNYVGKALTAAYASDKTARLLINDDDLEYDEPLQARKRDIYIRLLTGLRRENVPLGGFGLEAHLKPWRPFAEAAYRRFLHELGELGLGIYVTELDVCDKRMPPDAATRDKDVAAMTRRYLDVVLDEPSVHTVICWGLCDQTSWMVHDPAGRRDDGLPPRPLPYDSRMSPKPMRDALMLAFATARSRPSR